ncbi:MAG: septal ring lytic transglycosylase RlpA family protein [Proteobacteria bacterium]|nr:septal ring lytic transglycosylase RlpA family protein [Pseudomonadota bacterium]
MAHAVQGITMRLRHVMLAGIFLALGGCASTPRSVPASSRAYCVAGHGCYHVLASAAGYSARGTASWYGLGDTGRPTASGAPFDPQAMRIADKTLPFGTWVTIRNLRNGREAVAMVDDRGPFYGGRIMDATPAVARQLGFYESGTAPVRMSAVPKSALSAAQRQAARDDEHTTLVYARRHPYRIFAEAGRFAVRGVFDITATGVRVAVGIVRGVLVLGFDVLKRL